MSIIRIKRPLQWFDALRKYHIIIDGSKAGTISPGKTVEFPVEVGNHTIKVKIDWYSSDTLSLNVEANETKDYTVSSVKYGWLLLWLGIFSAYLLVNKYLYGIILFGIIVLTLTPYFIIKNKYLTIKEITHE